METDLLNTQIDLPDIFIDALVAGVAMKVVTSIKGYEQFYPNVVNAYEREIQKLTQGGAVPPRSMKFAAHKKGFF